MTLCCLGAKWEVLFTGAGGAADSQEGISDCFASWLQRRSKEGRRNWDVLFEFLPEDGLRWIQSIYILFLPVSYAVYIYSTAVSLGQRHAFSRQ
jgi:hypothetical protein